MEINKPEFSYPALDYTVESAAARNEIVKKIVDTIPIELLSPPDAKMQGFLERLSNYIIFAMDKEEKKEEKNILTDGRMVTIKKRETSFQSLTDKMENGNEDCIYNMIAEDKNILFGHKDPVNEADIAVMPELTPLIEAIEEVKKQYKAARGKKRGRLFRQLKQLYQDQYVIKGHYKPVSYAPTAPTAKTITQIDLSEKLYIKRTYKKNGQIDKEEIKNDCIIDLMNPEHVSALLCNYSDLKQESWSKFWADAYYLMEDLDNIIEVALKDNPLLYQLLIYKIDKKTNEEIRDLLYQEFDVKYTNQYISTLWRKKIPKMIAKAQEIANLNWYFTFVEKGKWKKCNRCGQIKLANSLFFSKNSGSKDGFYSICKECRNKKG